jgi:hypothetical protein
MHKKQPPPFAITKSKEYKSRSLSSQIEKRGESKKDEDDGAAKRRARV